MAKYTDMYRDDYYKQNQYQVRVISCAENDMIVFPVLLYGSAAVKLGAAEDLRRVIEALRERFPNVAIHVRANSGFGGPDVYDMLKSFANLTFTIALKINERTKKLSETLLEQTIAAQASTGEDQVKYLPIVGYKSRFWKNAIRNLVSARRVVIHLSASWPHLKYFQQVAAAIERFRPLTQ